MAKIKTQQERFSGASARACGAQPFLAKLIASFKTIEESAEFALRCIEEPHNFQVSIMKEDNKPLFLSAPEAQREIGGIAHTKVLNDLRAIKAAMREVQVIIERIDDELYKNEKEDK